MHAMHRAWRPNSTQPAHSRRCDDWLDTCCFALNLRLPLPPSGAIRNNLSVNAHRRGLAIALQAVANQHGVPLLELGLHKCLLLPLSFQSKGFLV